MIVRRMNKRQKVGDRGGGRSRAGEAILNNAHATKSLHLLPPGVVSSAVCHPINHLSRSCFAIVAVGSL